MKNYRIGLDIGIGSVGWAVLENDPVTEEPIKILNLGVRTFNPNEVAKTGESTAKSRREARGVHRRTRRRAFRLARAKNLIKQYLNVDAEKDLENLKNKDVYELRFKAIEEQVSMPELAKVILNIYKRRGFKSNRKALSSGGDDGKLLKATEQNKLFLIENGYRTIGEAIYKDSRFKDTSSGNVFYNVRNHAGEYQNCFLREDLKNELELILKTQQKFNASINDEFISKIVYIFEKQRNFDEGPGSPSPYNAKFEVGNCTFLPNEKRAPKASYTFELFNALSKINNLKIGENKLTIDQKKILHNIILEKESLTFEKVRKELNLPIDQLFNLCRYQIKSKKDDVVLSEEEVILKCEKSTFVSMKNSYSIKKKLGLESSFNNKELINEIALMLSLCKSDSTIDEYITNNKVLNKLTTEQISVVKELNFDKFGSLSIKAMEMVMPYLLEGCRYDEACQKAGFNHSSFEKEKQKYLKGTQIEEELKDITSNVVKRAVNQTLRVVNEIIKKYGSPQFVSIELARELSKNRAQRNEIEKRQKENELTNEKIKARIKELTGIENPSYFDVLKLRLYEEQFGKCMYSGGVIEEHRLFEPNYVQVDHILPFSKSLNDSYNNKVLVIADENQNKGNRTPYEFFGANEARWNAFVARVKTLRNREKQRNLLKEHISEEEQKEFIERNLNDTRYMSKFLLNLFQKYLLLSESGQYKKQVRSVSGSVTSYLRKCWGINKIREDGDVHHAIDACIIATAEEKQVQKISKFNKFKELFKQDHKNEVFINRTTGEVMTAAQKQEYEEQKIKLLGEKLPLPYDEFRKELTIRSRVNYHKQEFSEQEKEDLHNLGYEYEELENIKPLFVSRMKNVKTTGAIHKDTMMSAREYGTSKMLVKSVSLNELKINDKRPEPVALKGDKYPQVSIDNYYRPQDDRLLYLKLKNYLVEESFRIPETEVIRKPKKDGTDGPIVKKVKVYEKVSNCVITPNGAAANDTMHRIDIFEKQGKFYICPVYMADVYAKKLPNKVIEIGKEWAAIDDSYNFMFSLYQNDLIKIKSPRTMKFTKLSKNDKSDRPGTIEMDEALVYFNSLNISNAAIKVLLHDRCYEVGGLGVKTLLSIEKYYVDIMGNVYKAPKEERKEL